MHLILRFVGHLLVVPHKDIIVGHHAVAIETIIPAIIV
jgi:hypothetical protein